MGRTPKPTALKLLQGNPGKRAINKAEPQPTKLSTNLRPPAWLDPVAADRWRKLVPELRALGLLTVVDIDSLEAYCKAYSRWREAEEFLDDSGMTTRTESGYSQQRPQVAIARGYAEQMRKFASEFGLTPASRSRLAPSLTDPGEENKLGALMNRRRAKTG
jgi:P27 family predicted phage terminase small subunit